MAFSSRLRSASCSFAGIARAPSPRPARRSTDDLLRGVRVGERQVGLDAAEERLDGARHALERLLTGVEPREPQQIADEPLHPQRVARDDFEKSLASSVGVRRRRASAST